MKGSCRFFSAKRFFIFSLHFIIIARSTCLHACIIQYMCTSVPLLILSNPVDIRIMIEYDDSTDNNSPINVGRGENVNVNCSVSSYPPSTVGWDVENKTETGTSVLLSLNIAVDEDSTYSCIAEYNGTSRNESIEFTLSEGSSLSVMTTLIIIIAAVVSALAVLLFILVILILICCCLRRKKPV